MAVDPRFNKLWLWETPRVINPIIQFHGVISYLDTGPVLQADPFMRTLWVRETLRL